MASDFSLNTTIIDSSQLLERFFKEFPSYKSDEDKISAAWNYLVEKTGMLKRSCGRPYILHPMRVACVLAENKLDADTIIAGFLHNILEIEGNNETEIEEKFGNSVLSIIQSSARITNLRIKNQTLQQADSFRKMLFAMVDDIRVILVKLADRLDRLRNISSQDADVQKSIAQETIDIWAPLANRLGMASVKVEMEDLSLKFTNPDVYQQIKKIVDLKKNERSEYLATAEKEIYKTTTRAKIEVSVKSRAKHFYSIYQKMRKRNKEPGELYDLLAIRILCNSVPDCYTLIGLVHSLWKPMEGRFKDYIAMPKPNGYQSLHTTVMCGGKPLEIQIRTYEMHAVAEHGVASHWLYKKGTNKDLVDVNNLSIINQLKELRKDHLNDDEFFNEIKSELLGDSIYVFTPKGDVRELPSGATAVDFAYSIHSHIGETIVAAKANGHIIPLSSPLENTQIIEIITSPQAHPSVNKLQFVKTARARSKMRAWLAANDPNYEAGVTQKPTLIEKKVSGKDKVHKPGVGLEELKDTTNNKKKSKTSASTVDEDAVRIRIGDTTNFMISRAKCCNPKYGDDIVGYVSRGRGIIVHKASCSNFANIPNVNERSIPVVWDENPLNFEKNKKKK
ncbi:MAG: GTP pyrophosphokinase [Treponema sp. CETP13]|nr:MAG: GTP pyrophosphokinase [Treponema sp. CETP13]